MFNEAELLYNITNHKLVPKHEKVNEKEVLQKLKRLEFSNLPIILFNDPIIRYYNHKKGDIIRIKRNDNNIVYRIVK